MILKLTKKTLLYFIALVSLAFFCYPFVYMLSTSLKTLQDYFKSPFSLATSSFSLTNYYSVYQMGLFRYFVNSIIITTIAVLLTVAISSLASYPLSRLKFKLRGPLFLLLISGMMLPVHATLIPIFIMSNQFHIYDTWLALLGPYIGFSLPVSIFIFTRFMSDFPREIEEAAKIDGCGHLSTYLKIIMPVMTPAISTVVIYNFIHLWGEFIFALVLINTPERMTLPLGLQHFNGEFSVNVPGLMAAITMASIPLFLIFIFAQEKVVKGLVSGAVK